jgi:hypothetical protein
LLPYLLGLVQSTRVAAIVGVRSRVVTDNGTRQPHRAAGVQKTGTRRERTTQNVTTSALSGVASAPGLLNRIGLLLL